MEKVGGIDQSEVFRLEPQIYLVRLAGHLTLEGSTRLNDLIRGDSDGKHAVLYETTQEFTGYDPRLRRLRQNPALQGMTHIGVITTNPILRIVASAVGIGVRATTGVPMSAYGSVESALAGARSALGRG